VYASDFAGPVSLDDAYERVIVDEIPQLLSEEERALLQQLRPPDTIALSEDVLMHNFALAKTFVQEAYNHE
jgi:hypothetical protein